jgi:hypothetical protein
MDEFCFPCTSYIMAASTHLQLGIAYDVRKIHTKGRPSRTPLVPSGSAVCCRLHRSDEPRAASSHIERIA